MASISLLQVGVGTAERVSGRLARRRRSVRRHRGKGKGCHRGSEASEGCRGD